MPDKDAGPAREADLREWLLHRVRLVQKEGIEVTKENVSEVIQAILDEAEEHGEVVKRRIDGEDVYALSKDLKDWT